MHLRIRHAVLAAATVAASALCLSAQGAENLKILNFESKIGSFKAMGTDNPAHGLLQITFSGTVLVSGLNGKVAMEGNIIKEYDDAPHKKQVYHGTGKMTVDGDFTGIQFFGKDLKGRFVGVSIFRLYGEFDKDLNTGSFWYDGGDKRDWGTGGMQLPVPGYAPNAFKQRPVPTVKVKT